MAKGSAPGKPNLQAKPVKAGKFQVSAEKQRTKARSGAKVSRKAKGC